MFRSQGGPLSSVPLTCFLRSEDRLLCFPGAASPTPSGSLSLRPPAPAGVAVSLTSLATTVRAARRRGFWAVEGALWRVLLLAFVAKPELWSQQT